MKKTPFIAANWKMNKSINEAALFINNFKKSVKKIKNVEIVVCPPFTSLYGIKRLIKNSNIKLGAQNMFYEEKGAFTGEISPLMLKDAGCEYVILGHSERRHYFSETNALINKKIILALKKGLKPILCIGETLEQRNSNLTTQVINKQLQECLKNVLIQKMKSVIIAYEPIWAIGTGRNAAPKQAEEIHKFVKDTLTKMYNGNTTSRIIYGGSVNSDNISDLMEMGNIDGALIGGASLEADLLSQICLKASKS